MIYEIFSCLFKKILNSDITRVCHLKRVSRNKKLMIKSKYIDYHQSFCFCKYIPTLWSTL